MKKAPFNRLIFLSLFLFSLCSMRGYAQRFSEFELQGNMFCTDIDDGTEFAFGIAGKRSFWLNPYVGMAVGAMMNYSKIDRGFQSPTDSKVYYRLDEPIVNLNGIVGLKLSTPTYKKVGMMADFNFMFAPIPFYPVGIEKEISAHPGDAFPKEKSKTRIAYTKFSPSYSVEFSLFYENKANGGRGRIAVGGGITNYNPYSPYYHAKIDNLRLRECTRLRPDDIGVVLFIRLSGSN